jgi:hypothetical protein
MNIEKAYYDEAGKMLFHLRLCSGHINRWYTSLPPPLILKYFQSEIFHLKNALIVKETQAIRLIDALARKILKKQEMKPFFYPNYLDKEPDSNDLDTLIWLQYKFEFKPNMVFNSIICPIEFYYVEQIFKMNAGQILKTGTKIKYTVLVEKYLKNSFVKEAFELVDNESAFYVEMGDEQFDYVIIVCEAQLLMIISA